MSENQQKEAKKPKCSWNTEDDSILLGVLRQCKEDGKQSGAGWKPSVWTDCEAALKEKGSRKGAPKTASKCTDHYTNLKGNFAEVFFLLHCSGFGWNDGTKMVEATEKVWSDLLAKKPKLKKWRKATFPHYDDMMYLVKGVVATGDNAYHAGSTPPPSSPPQLASSPRPSSPVQEADRPTSDAESATQDPVTPAPSRRRARAPTDSPEMTVSAKRQRRGKGHRHVSQAESTLDVAAAINRISDALASSAATPARRRQAIQLVDADGEYSSDEEDKIIGLFTDNMIYADTYLSIPKKERRVRFIRNRLQKLADSDDL